MNDHQELMLYESPAIEIDLRVMKSFHWRRSFADEISPALRKFHRAQAKILQLKLKATTQNAWTWKASIEAHTPKPMKSKFDSHCEICKRACFAPRGNYNAKRISLCDRLPCIRKRRCELQRARRAQRELIPRTSIVDAARKAKRKAKAATA